MQKKSWIKYLSIIMFAAVLALIGSNNVSYAADENPVEENPVVENECDGFSCVEENGVILLSEDDVLLVMIV